MNSLGWVALLFMLAGLVAYWELVIAEGTHLGQRAVTWLYDITAPRYDSIKRFDPAIEDDFLGLPLALALAEASEPLVLDVATGTGRCALTLLRQPAFDGRVIGLDPSRRMLLEARRKASPFGERASWVQQVGGALPFPEDTFAAVTCLEALEFTADPHVTVCECLRVLKPGGLLLVTNRIGPDAFLLFGKTFSREAFRRFLDSLPLAEYRVAAWQVGYDLAWARKARA